MAVTLRSMAAIKCGMPLSATSFLWMHIRDLVNTASRMTIILFPARCSLGGSWEGDQQLVLHVALDD